MAGFVSGCGHCILCGAVFTFNPLRVPSLRVDGTRHPVCSGCITARVNPSRRKQGLEDLVVAEDAYDAIPEEELPFDDYS